MNPLPKTIGVVKSEFDTIIAELYQKIGPIELRINEILVIFNSYNEEYEECERDEMPADLRVKLSREYNELMIIFSPLK